MGMDRNTVIGFVLIGALLIGMFVINSKSRLAYEAEQKRIADSIERFKPKVDPKIAVLDSLKADSIKNIAAGIPVNNIAEKKSVLENDLIKIVFSNKGAQPVLVQLKKFKKQNGDTVILQQGSFNQFDYSFNSAANKSAQTSKITFDGGNVTINADKSQTVTYFLGDSTGKKLTHTFTLKPADYMLDFNIGVGDNSLFNQNEINFVWQNEADQIEHDYKYEATQTHICYLENGDYDFEMIGSHDNELSFSKPVEWLSVKQQFFLTALVAKNKFRNTAIKWKVPADSSSHFLTKATATAKLEIVNGNVPLQVYYGPSDYTVLKKYGNKLENIVPYGSGVFAFVKYINRYLLLPVFNFFANNIASMGIVILLLTFFIRLLTSPILYKSYLSGAKMKALKPEVDALKAKYTDPKTNTLDQQAFGMEQMKLWRSAGVSPLGGCLPALLQIPIFMSLYYFFQSNIDLRGENFLWAKDLATYDSIATLPFSIPFYGDHVSLFTLTAVITSMLISIYSMSSMQDQSNPLMKYMPYVFPVLLLGVFNNLPAALTWYYTVSNIITLAMQYVIQNYIIDHEKILFRIKENMKKPVKQSKLQERIAAMQEQQKKIQDMKNKR
ncbi:MAG: membrane protein insertase YidC [Bacteroidetes bacterium]|nr:membrane protein insertase YidC [Bacteroidota bacterium]